MRIAALFCGLIAGLFALAAPAGLGIDLLTPFRALWGSAPGQQLLGTVAWYAPVVAAILGGLLAFVAPGPGALLLGAAGIGWLGLGVVDSAFFRFEVLVPGVASLVGSLLAVLAGELELRRRRLARRNRRDTLRDRRAEPDDIPDMPEAPERPVRQERAERSQRTTRAESEARARENEARAREEAQAREAAFNIDPLTVSRDEAPPRPSREIPLTLEDVVPVETPEPRRRPPERIWPDAPSARRSMFDRDSAPDLQPRRSLFDRPATRVDRADRDDRPSRRDRDIGRGRDRDRSYREREREPEYYDDEPAPRRSMFVWIVAGNAVLLVVLVLVVAYMMVERSSGPAATDVAVVAAVPETPATPTSVAIAETQVPAATDPTDRLTPNLLPSLAPLGAELPVAAADTPAVVAEAPAAAGGFSDPFAYCGAVRTVDYVDNRYVGPRFTAAIADALRVPMESAPDRVSWRCVDGVVYACASFDWPVCSMTPTAQEMLDYCQRNPGVTRLLAPNGTWSCEGSRPRIPDGASWPVDARGFFPAAWIPVLPQQQPAG